MKRFLTKIFVFLSFPILYFGINMCVNAYVYHHRALPVRKNNVLIAGDSHLQKSVNPDYFASAQNISQLGEPYVLTFWKLKQIFKSAVPDTLLLGFAPHNISAFNDLKFSNDSWSNEMFSRSYPIEEFKTISTIVPVDYKTFYKVLWKQTAFYPKKNHGNYIGKYVNRKTSNVSDYKSAAERHYYEKGMELGISRLSIEYLDSIVMLCRSRNIKLVLVNSPVHQKYSELIPADIRKEYMQLENKYRADRVLIFRASDIYADSLFLNADHLNEYGAKRFTNELVNFLNSKSKMSGNTYMHERPDGLHQAISSFPSRYNVCNIIRYSAVEKISSQFPKYWNLRQFLCRSRILQFCQTNIFSCQLCLCLA